MTYGVVGCSGCGRLRVADLKAKRSACPYCGRSVESEKLSVRYESEDQSLARAALTSLSGFEMPEPEEKGEDPDPISTLHYRYRKCGSDWRCVEMLAQGLTEILGEFALSDLEEADPKRGGKILKAMLENGIAVETKPGRYRYV